MSSVTIKAYFLKHFEAHYIVLDVLVLGDIPLKNGWGDFLF